jgi:hypothetical protein
MHAPPDPKMRRGGPPQATPEVAKSRTQKRYHTFDDVQALLLALSPLWFAILIVLYVRASR